MITPCVCNTVRKANRSLSRLYENAFDGTGVTVTQFTILRALQREGATPLSRLADALIMERTSLYRSISPLEKNGSVEIVDGSNRKIRVAKLTAIGEGEIQRVMPAWERVQTKMVTALGADQWETLSASLLAIPSLVEDLDTTR